MVDPVGSVVVAAGNDGVVENYWENAAHNKPLNVPKEFTQNDLGVEEATVVGATRNWEGTHYPAEYNNRYGGVDAGRPATGHLLARS